MTIKTKSANGKGNRPTRKEADPGFLGVTPTR